MSVVLPHKQVFVSILPHKQVPVYTVSLLPHWQVFFSTVTTLASACLYCYHTGKCISVVSTIYTLAHICQCYKYYHIGKYLSILLPLFLVFTTQTSICQYCYHIRKCMSILLPHWQVFFSTVTTLASACLYC